MKHGKKFGFWMISMVIALSLALPSISSGKSRKESGKWMTGDWHQHTFFTDGTNFMRDVEIDYSTAPPTFKIIHKYTNAASNFMPVREGASGKNEYKGGMTQGFLM